MNLSKQDDYVWAMRNAYTLIKNDNQKTVTPEELINRLMASLVPDEVIYNFDDFTAHSYDGCLIFADLSGFTELCEKYHKAGIGGPSRVTQVLNKYLGAMVHEIMIHEGDVLKFSGDAFLALWRTSQTKTMNDVVHKAIDCALVIQKYYNSHKTDIDTILKVKLSISAGPVEFSIIGDEHISHYVIVGEPVWDIKTAGLISKAGDIIVSLSAWMYVHPNEYKVEKLSDGKHVKVVDFGGNWHSAQKRSFTTTNQNAELRHIGFENDSLNSTSDSSLRPSVDVAVRLNIHEHLRKFIIEPLMESIKMNEPFIYLSEMRQVVVVFINVVYMKMEPRKVIDLANESYKLVCHVVEEAHGCVNKVSLFDKDMMFLVIFGLRGLKHELESQIALKCATECRQAIRKLQTVISVSIGITTGKTYCGVFGHQLRREYTVISLTVNKAARLMMAYRNKVTCDRETFLNSKLEPRNFILQKEKELKGISQPGPIYEFRRVTNYDCGIISVSRFPLLGRHDKLILYQQLLGDFLNLPEKSGEQIKKMLVIQGVTRQGKTRLLQELIYITPKELPIYMFSLSKKDSKIPYYTLRLILFLPIALHPESTREEKESKITLTLEEFLTPQFHSTANELFGTNYPEANDQSLTAEMKMLLAVKLLRHFLQKIFKTKWIFVLDNCEYIDDKSWEYIDLLLKYPNIFILASIDYGKSISTRIDAILNSKSVKVTIMKAIDRWFHGALACQFLKVYAISPELEKVIQVKSNGNPGWIQSFVISLEQSGSVIRKTIDMKKVHDAGLICPPLYMIKRLSFTEREEWQQLMEEKHPSIDVPETEDNWKKYIDSCRDSYVEVVVREQLQIKFKCPSIVPALLIKDNHLNNIDPESSIDIAILRTFDSLLSDAQMVVKCGASLGDQFLRDMLLYVMECNSQRDAALAIKKLFELRILACAKGDFVDGRTPVTTDRTRAPQNYKDIVCECRGNKIHETCEDLPKYASCGYMQFYNTHFREISYHLLTDEQKKEFHLRAIRYLEKETRRCHVCGGGPFNQLSKTMLVHGQKKQASFTLLLTDSSLTNPSQSAPSTSDDMSESGTPLLPQVSSLTFLNKKNTKKFKSIWGFRYISKLKHRTSLVRDFSNKDFLDCKCLSILTTAYSQLVEHYRGAGQWSRLIEIMLQYSEVSIYLSNIPLALTILKDALNVLNITPKNEFPWQINYIRGKVYSMLGYAYIELDELQEAEVYLQLALKQYNCKFPHNHVTTKSTILKLRSRQFFGFFVLPNTMTKKNLTYWESYVYNSVSEILSRMAALFMMKNQWDYAELAAIWSLSKALKSSNDFVVTCLAYCKMLLIATHFKRVQLCEALEIYALRLCHMRPQNMELEELKAITKLYTSIFWSTLLHKDTEHAKQIGYSALRTATSVFASKLILPILPMLAYCFLLNKHIDTTALILDELNFFAQNDYNEPGRVWYFAQCISFHLETGYTIIVHEECEKFYKTECGSFLRINDLEARQRYVVVMWLWYVRNRIWEMSTFWQLHIQEFFRKPVEDSVANHITTLYLLEGLIISLVYSIDVYDIENCAELEKQIEKLIKALEEYAKITKIILPRLYHMKAYYRQVKYNDAKAYKYLEEAHALAVKYNNVLEQEWTTHSLRAWKQTIPAVALEFWRDHCSKDNQLNYHEIEKNQGKFGYFTLPLPTHVP